jgi:hypothetical protein
MKPKTVVKKWEDMCAKVLKTREREMRKPVKQRKKKNMKKGPGGYAARATAKLAGMRSMGEVYCAADMDRRGIKWHYEHEKLEYKVEKVYNPDFTLYEDDNLLIEYKGKMTATTRSDLMAIKKCHPNRKICLVFERAENKLTSAKNSWRYWEWAEKNGFEWSDKVVRDEWLAS